MILPLVLHRCEICSLTLREEHRLRVFEEVVLRRVFGPKRDDVTGEWRKLHSVKLHNLFSSPNIIRQIRSRLMRWARHVERRGESVQVVWWESPKKRDDSEDRELEDGIRMDLKENGWWCEVDSTDSG
jgi:hypothetical protein